MPKKEVAPLLTVGRSFTELGSVRSEISIKSFFNKNGLIQTPKNIASSAESLCNESRLSSALPNGTFLKSDIDFNKSLTSEKSVASSQGSYENISVESVYETNLTFTPVEKPVPPQMMYRAFNPRTNITVTRNETTKSVNSTKYSVPESVNTVDKSIYSSKLSTQESLKFKTQPQKLGRTHSARNHELTAYI